MDNKSPPCTNERENMSVVECPSNGPILYKVGFMEHGRKEKNSLMKNNVPLKLSIFKFSFHLL